MRISDWSSDVCSSDLTPGCATRFGPSGGRGLAWSDQIGSVRILRPAACTSTVACPTQVATMPRGAAKAGGRDGLTATMSGQIGRASCRERVCQYVYISVVAGSLQKKKKT